MSPVLPHLLFQWSKNEYFKILFQNPMLHIIRKKILNWLDFKKTIDSYS